MDPLNNMTMVPNYHMTANMTYIYPQNVYNASKFDEENNPSSSNYLLKSENPTINGNFTPTLNYNPPPKEKSTYPNKKHD